MRGLLTSIITIFFFFELQAQTIENLQLSFYRDSLLVEYDITDPENESYSISLFSSHDNFKEPLTYVSGDVGEVVQSGRGKRIVWNIAEELTEFNGPLAVEIRGYFKALPVRFTRVPEKVKRGKSMELQWSGGRPATGYIFQLFQNALKVDEQEIRDSRSLDYPVSAKMKPGAYELKLISIDPGGSEVIFPVRITRKIPLGLQFSPGYALLGFGLYLLTKPEPPGPLPVPPNPNDIGN